MEKDIKYLKGRFANERIWRKKEDIEALNNIIDGYNEMKKASLAKNKLFIKMFINEFLKQTTITCKTSSAAIFEVEKILKETQDEWYYRMRSNIPYLRFERLSENIGIIPLYEINGNTIEINNDEATLKRNKELLEKHKAKLQRAISIEYTEEELKEFLDKEIFNLITKYSNYD